ncbi:MAG: NMD3-related protein [Candidatus Altiarchaeota archaeon]|nr:NMD3-related protein [Candidatus Altiarchaeota archaeon]
MFCPKCGREGDGLCLDCYLDDNPLYLEHTSLLLCNCGRTRYKNSWESSLEDVLSRVVKNKLVVPGELKTIDVRLEGFSLVRNKIELRILFSGEYLGEEFRKEVTGQMGLTRGNCSFCGRISAGYYESILQLRVKNPRQLFEGINHSLVSKVENVRGGVDIYLTSSGYGSRLMKELRDRGFLVRDSYALMGKKEGKDVYRSSISVKEPSFEVGDLIRYNNRLLQVLKRGSTVKLKDPDSGKHVSLPLTELSDLTPVAKASDVKRCIVTSVSPHDLQLLSLEDNKTLELENTKGTLKQGDEVKVIELDHRVYILD